MMSLDIQQLTALFTQTKESKEGLTALLKYVRPILLEEARQYQLNETEFKNAFVRVGVQTVDYIRQGNAPEGYEQWLKTVARDCCMAEYRKRLVAGDATPVAAPRESSPQVVAPPREEAPRVYKQPKAESRDDGRSGTILRRVLAAVLVLALLCGAFFGVRALLKKRSEKPKVVPTPYEKKVDPEALDVGAVIESEEETTKAIQALDSMDWSAKEAQIKKLQEPYLRFALQMMRDTYRSGENYVSSPLSAYYVMAMLSNAAVGDTATQLENVLGMSSIELNRSLYALTQTLQPSYLEYEPIHFGNAFWMNSDFAYAPNENYQRILDSYYDSELFSESFADDATLNNMNAWVSKHTNGLINNLMTRDNVTDKTTFVLCNALAMEDRWQNEFSTDKNTTQAFHNASGTAVEREMMHSVETGYWSDSQAQGIYKTLNDGYVIFLLPNEGVSIDTYVAGLKDSTLKDFPQQVIFEANETDTSIENHYTNLTLPKFQNDNTLALTETLKRMGITRVFEEDANLSRMVSEPYENLFVADVIQKATMDMNEKGLSAAAATMAGGAGAAAPEKEIVEVFHDLVLDRPFVYVVSSADMPLFIGVVNELDGKEVTEETPEPAPEPTPEPTPTPSEGVIGKATIVADGLNIRYGPATTYGVVDFAPMGYSYDVYETTTAGGYTWYRIGTNRWIASDGKWVDYKANS